MSIAAIKIMNEPSMGVTIKLPQRYSENLKQYAVRGGLLTEDELFRQENLLWRHDPVRFSFFCLAFDQIVKEKIGGDFVELGVHQGQTAEVLAKFARKIGRQIYLLDTFSGFPEQDLCGLDSCVRPSYGDTSLEMVRGVVGEGSTHYVQGYFPGTISQLPENGAYGLVHLDCDLQAPTLAALEYFYPRLVPGGFLIVHDYGSFYWAGLEVAVDEFFHDKPEQIIPIPDACGTVVVRKI